MSFDPLKDEKRFREESAYSYEAAEFLAARLTADGWPARVVPLSLRPTFADRAAYADDGDVFIDLLVTLRVESKRRRENFTSPEDFKFPTIIVDNVSSYDAKSIKPWCYFVQNEYRTACLEINVKQTRDQWKINTRPNRKSGHITEVYECPIALVKKYW